MSPFILCDDVHKYYIMDSIDDYNNISDGCL